MDWFRTVVVAAPASTRAFLRGTSTDTKLELFRTKTQLKNRDRLLGQTTARAHAEVIDLAITSDNGTPTLAFGSRRPGTSAHFLIAYRLAAD